MTHLHGSSLFLLFIKSAARTAFPSVPHGLLYPQRVPLVLRQLLGLLLGLAVQLHGREGQVFQHRHVRVQVEPLEHHAGGLAHKLGLVFGRQLLSVYVDMAAGGLFQKIHAAHCGGLA